MCSINLLKSNVVVGFVEEIVSFTLDSGIDSGLFSSIETGVFTMVFSSFFCRRNNGFWILASLFEKALELNENRRLWNEKRWFPREGKGLVRISIVHKFPSNVSKSSAYESKVDFFNESFPSCHARKRGVVR